jgi:hypothetical protein
MSAAEAVNATAAIVAVAVTWLRAAVVDLAALKAVTINPALVAEVVVEV